MNAITKKTRRLLRYEQWYSSIWNLSILVLVSIKFNLSHLSFGFYLGLVFIPVIFFLFSACIQFFLGSFQLSLFSTVFSSFHFQFSVNTGQSSPLILVIHRITMEYLPGSCCFRFINDVFVSVIFHKLPELFRMMQFRVWLQIRNILSCN